MPFRVLYVANAEQTLSDAFPFVVCICLVWLCNCTKYHWNLYERRTQKANSTYVNTSCCICLCILLILIIFRIPWRRRLQTTDAKGYLELLKLRVLNLSVCMFKYSIFNSLKRSLQTMDATCLITCMLYSLFIMYDVHDDNIIIYWRTLLLQDWSTSR